MCMFAATPAAPVLPPETAPMRPPDGAVVKSASQRRAMERNAMRSPTILTSGRGVLNPSPIARPGLGTILTSAQGVMAGAQTIKKSLLGA
jgi:hypothetical protein